jgi:hypothetical protein
MNENLLKGSDKQFWHRYIPIYDEELGKLTKCSRILEFGVFKGESIRWINNKFPNAEIFACDILPIQSEWPIAQNIKYSYVDQGSPETIKALFKTIGDDLDLIIEDGSHLPDHQKNCLIESLRHISSGGIYILEDLHTSHPEHFYYKKIGSNYIGPFHLLLCFEHLISTGKNLDKNILKEISSNSLFTSEQIEYIFQKISNIKIYKRATLPHKCYFCGSTDFNYHKLKCKCGTGLYSPSDSITAIITAR